MIIYPSNLDLLLTRKEGRKISKKQALPKPEAKELFDTLLLLGEKNTKLEKNSAYPRNSLKKSGRVVIDTQVNKLDLMKRVAKEIKRERALS